MLLFILIAVIQAIPLALALHGHEPVPMIATISAMNALVFGYLSFSVMLFAEEARRKGWHLEPGDVLLRIFHTQRTGELIMNRHDYLMLPCACPGLREVDALSDAIGLAKTVRRLQRAGQ